MMSLLIAHFDSYVNIAALSDIVWSVIRYNVGVVTGSWTVEEMSAVLEAQPSVVRRHLGFWVTQGVLREGQHDMFTVVEQANDAGRNRGLGLCVYTCVLQCTLCSFVSRRDGRQRLCHGFC